MDIDIGGISGPGISITQAAAERQVFVIQGGQTFEDSLLNAVRALHARCLPDLTSAAGPENDVDWSALLEPSDESDCPATIVLKAVGLPEFGDPACNVVLIG